MMQMSARDPLIGTCFVERYEIEELIGKGGFGKVYLARHRILQRKFAIKILHADLHADEMNQARFRREARTASRIHHPHIAYVFDFGCTPSGITYLAMEYIEGKTLAQIIESEGPISIERTLAILIQMADALAAAHARKVIHRDIKPINILLTEQSGHKDFVKILDFGLAKVVDQLTSPGSMISMEGQVFGTPEYAAPEVLNQAADFRSDIYSFGIVAYEMLTGRVPFQGPPWEVMKAQMEKVPLSPKAASGRDDIPQLLDSLVLKCLEKNPHQRYSETRHLKQALEQVVSNLHPESQVHSVIETETPHSNEVPNIALASDQPLTSLEDLVDALRDQGLGSPEFRFDLVEILLERVRLRDIDSKLKQIAHHLRHQEPHFQMLSIDLRQALHQLEQEQTQTLTNLSVQTHKAQSMPHSPSECPSGESDSRLSALLQATLSTLQEETARYEQDHAASIDRRNKLEEEYQTVTQTMAALQKRLAHKLMGVVQNHTQILNSEAGEAFLRIFKTR